MGNIERRECPNCGALRGDLHSGSCGVYPRQRVVLHQTVTVEYVPASQFAGAVEDRDRYRAALERAGRALNRGGWIDESQAALDTLKGGQSETKGRAPARAPGP